MRDKPVGRYGHRVSVNPGWMLNLDLQKILMNEMRTKVIVQIIMEARIPQIVSSILPSEKAKIS